MQFELARSALAQRLTGAVIVIRENTGRIHLIDLFSPYQLHWASQLKWRAFKVAFLSGNALNVDVWSRCVGQGENDGTGLTLQHTLFGGAWNRLKAGLHSVSFGRSGLN